MKQHLIWIDALRGLLILLVVLGHSLQNGDFESRLDWSLINCFHVPAFFFVSGFVSYKTQLEWGSLGRRVKQLMVPFLVWVLIDAVLSGNFLHRVTDCLLHPDNGYWFLPVLFAVILLFYIFDTLARRLKISQMSAEIVGG